MHMKSEFEATSEALRKELLDQGEFEHIKYVYRLGLKVRFGTTLDDPIHDSSRCSTCQFIEARLKSTLALPRSSSFESKGTFEHFFRTHFGSQSRQH